MLIIAVHVSVQSFAEIGPLVKKEVGYIEIHSSSVLLYIFLNSNKLKKALVFLFFFSDLISVITANSVDPDTIFANNEMSLRDIEIYGFDYDYTLAFYSSHLHTLIFNIARDILVTKHRVCVVNDSTT